MSALDPITIVELRQPRCALRFGVSPCPATGTPKCYNTWTSCQNGASRAEFDASGRIRWRFVANRPGMFAVGDFGDPDDPATNAIPVDGLQVSTSQSQINVGGVLDGKSPFGIRATVSVSMRDFPWDDHVGDFYIADRIDLPQRMFWAVWTARNMFYGGMEIVIYEGYAGDSLAAMRQRLYKLDNVDGPDASGNVTLRGVDPLVEAEGETSKFPPDMAVALVSAITSAQTTIRVYTDDETNLSRTLGIGGERGVTIGSEILLYAGYTVVEPGIYDLTGCTRGMFNTVAATAAVDSRVQRIGWFNDVPTWECGRYLLTDHTPVDAALIGTSWQSEGDDYLAIFRSTTVIAAPTAVATLMGQIAQQGMFYCWWDEYSQKIEMLAMRAPDGAVTQIDTVSGIVETSAELRREPGSLLTRVFVYYGPYDPTKSDEANFRVIEGVVEATNEAPQAAGKPYVLTITARWINTPAHAQFLIARILSRYRVVPRFLTFRISAKDREIQIGEVCDITTGEVVDSEGRVRSSRWQVISIGQAVPGEVYILDTQTFDLIGRFGAWMDAAEPDYDVATDDERAAGGWWADNDGLMPDGSDGYQWG